MTSHNPLNFGFRNAGANEVRVVMQATIDNAKPEVTSQEANTPPERSDSSRICPSDCLSDWDKQKTPAVNCCYPTHCSERLVNERRGQDSNLRTPCRVTGLANPRFRPLSHLSKLLSYSDL